MNVNEADTGGLGGLIPGGTSGANSYRDAQGGYGGGGSITTGGATTGGGSTGADGYRDAQGGYGGGSTTTGGGTTGHGHHGGHTGQTGADTFRDAQGGYTGGGSTPTGGATTGGGTTGADTHRDAQGGYNQHGSTTTGGGTTGHGTHDNFTNHIKITETPSGTPRVETEATYTSASGNKYSVGYNPDNVAGSKALKNGGELLTMKDGSQVEVTAAGGIYRTKAATNPTSQGDQPSTTTTASSTTTGGGTTSSAGNPDNTHDQGGQKVNPDGSPANTPSGSTTTGGSTATGDSGGDGSGDSLARGNGVGKGANTEPDWNTNGVDPTLGGYGDQATLAAHGGATATSNATDGSVVVKTADGTVLKVDSQTGQMSPYNGSVSNSSPASSTTTDGATTGGGSTGGGFPQHSQTDASSGGGYGRTGGATGADTIRDAQGGYGSGRSTTTGGAATGGGTTGADSFRDAQGGYGGGANSTLTAPAGVIGPVETNFTRNGTAYWVMSDGRVYAKGVNGNVYKMGDYGSAQDAVNKLNHPNEKQKPSKPGDEPVIIMQGGSA